MRTIMITIFLGTAPLTAQQPVVWRLSTEPLVHIGVVEGDPNLEMDNVSSSIRLSDGRFAVANSGSREIRFFDAQGRFLRKTGGRGNGPGEFRWLGRLYTMGRDSILAFDWAARRFSVFSAAGDFSRTIRADSMGWDAAFPADAWIYRFFMVDGAGEPTPRAAAKRALDRLPPVTSAPGYRYVRVALTGDIWVREPQAANATTYRWTVFDTTARAMSVIETPLTFDVHQIGSDYVLGRWRNEDDVNFVRLHRIERTTSRAPALPSWLIPSTAAPEHPAPLTTAERASRLAALRSFLRQMVSAQEGNYADHSTYTTDYRTLKFTLPETISVDILFADSRGWTAIAVDRGLGIICGMGVGSSTPPGWNEGEPTCAR